MEFSTDNTMLQKTIVYDFDYVLSKNYQIIISQFKKGEDFIFEIVIVGNKKVEFYNNFIRGFENVRLYTSDLVHAPFTSDIGVLKSFKANDIAGMNEIWLLIEKFDSQYKKSPISHFKKDCHRNTEIVLVGMEKMDLFLGLLDIQIIVKETQNPMNELAQMLDVSVIVVVYRRIYL